MFGLQQAMFAVVVIRGNSEDGPLEGIMSNLKTLASAVDTETLGRTAAELSNRMTLERRAQTGAIN